MRWIRVSFLCAALALAGCASQRIVDSDVQSYSHLTALPAPPSYHFERLPSQQHQDPQQSAIETAAAQALTKVGMRLDGTAPAYRVQVYAHTERALSPDWYDPWWDGGWGPGWGGGWGWGGWGGRGFYGGLSMRFPPPRLYRHEVGLILRDAVSGNVAYETHAVHEGLWSDNPALFGALFDAALSGFPLPPQGPRRIHIEIPR
ncbi:DUF4136 domain-containing protein [Simplicispira psychrophila]|uniref:DUF4136 domain-containing protein n=1 Tax=Simplicispira psychrophila TaxID=80882 RepID=UPI000484DDC2|nr:DUF4136 domain-containing protein [Simplicispira psychrophila]